MDAEVLTTVEQLLEEVAQIRQLGKRWGFSEEEINVCISEALNLNKNQGTKSGKLGLATAGKLRRFCWYACVTWLVFLSLMFTAYIGASVLDDKTQMQLTKHLIPLAYPLLRYSRLLSLPLHDMYNITDYYTAECLVENPWFDESLDSCWHCDRKNKVKEFTPQSSATWRDSIEVGVFKSSLDHDVDFASLRQMIVTNKKALGAEMKIFESNVSKISSPADLLNGMWTEQKILHTDGFHVLWHSNDLAVNRIVRQFFGRPPFISSKTEVSFEKTVIIEGPGTQLYTLPSQTFPTVWYTQASGSRNIRVLPNSHCRQRCKSYNLTLRPKDTVVFMDAGWTIQLLPLEIKEVSLGYIGSFN